MTWCHHDLFHPSMTPGFKFQLLPRTKGLHIYSTLNDRAEHRGLAECEELRLSTVHRGQDWREWEKPQKHFKNSFSVPRFEPDKSRIQIKAGKTERPFVVQVPNSVPCPFRDPFIMCTGHTVSNDTSETLRRDTGKPPTRSAGQAVLAPSWSWDRQNSSVTTILGMSHYIWPAICFTAF